MLIIIPVFIRGAPSDLLGGGWAFFLCKIFFLVAFITNKKLNKLKTTNKGGLVCSHASYSLHVSTVRN